MTQNSNATNDRIACFSVSGVDGKTTGATLIFTPTSKFTSTQVTVELTTVSGFISAASFSVGSNGASYNNILAITALTGLSTVNNYINVPIVSLSSTISAGTGIYVNVTTGATATTYIIKVSITGFYD